MKNAETIEEYKHALRREFEQTNKLARQNIILMAALERISESCCGKKTPEVVAAEAMEESIEEARKE